MEAGDALVPGVEACPESAQQWRYLLSVTESLKDGFCVTDV